MLYFSNIYTNLHHLHFHLTLHLVMSGNQSPAAILTSLKSCVGQSSALHRTSCHVHSSGSSENQHEILSCWIWPLTSVPPSLWTGLAADGKVIPVNLLQGSFASEFSDLVINIQLREEHTEAESIREPHNAWAQKQTVKLQIIYCRHLGQAFPSISI